MEPGLRIALRDPERSQSESNEMPRRSRDPTVCKVKLIVGKERQIIYAEEKLLKHVPFIIQKISTGAKFSLSHLVPNAVNTVLDFMWSGNVDRVATNEEIHQIILVCVEFGLDELKSQCIDILQRLLTPESVDEIKKIGVSVRSAKLIRAVDNFVGSARNKLLSQNSLEDMSFAEIDSSLRTCKEKEYQGKFLLSIVKWVKYKESERKHLLFNLLKCVNLDDVYEISPETFHNEICEGSIFYNDLQCLQLSYRVLKGKTQIAEQGLAVQMHRQFKKQTAAVRSCGSVPIPIRLSPKRSKLTTPRKELTLTSTLHSSNQIEATTRLEGVRRRIQIDI